MAALKVQVAPALEKERVEGPAALQVMATASASTIPWKEGLPAASPCPSCEDTEGRGIKQLLSRSQNCSTQSLKETQCGHWGYKSK